MRRNSSPGGMCAHHRPQIGGSHAPAHGDEGGAPARSRCRFRLRLSHKPVCQPVRQSVVGQQCSKGRRPVALVGRGHQSGPIPACLSDRCGGNLVGAICATASPGSRRLVRCPLGAGIGRSASAASGPARTTGMPDQCRREAGRRAGRLELVPRARVDAAPRRSLLNGAATLRQTPTTAALLRVVEGGSGALSGSPCCQGASAGTSIRLRSGHRFDVQSSRYGRRGHRRGARGARGCRAARDGVCPSVR
jgi:hypothetical protein